MKQTYDIVIAAQNQLINKMTTISMGGNTYDVRPGSLLEKVLERSTAQSLQRVGNAELVKTLETTDVIETRIDRYTALLFAADVADIAAVRTLSEAIA